MNSFTEKGLIWPVVIILLLLGSVVTMGTFVFMANSDGGAKVVDSYYQKAVQWDSLSVVRKEVKRRKWVSYLVLSEGYGSLVVTDSTQTKVDGLTGFVTMNQPHINTSSEKIDLSWQPSDSTYRFATSNMAPGIWDFIFEVQHQGTALEFDLRKSIR